MSFVLDCTVFVARLCLIGLLSDYNWRTVRFFFVVKLIALQLAYGKVGFLLLNSLRYNGVR